MFAPGLSLAANVEPDKTVTAFEWHVEDFVPYPTLTRRAQFFIDHPWFSEANGAWLAVQVIAHNLARWTARIGLGEGIVTTKTLRRRLFSLGRAAHRSARRVTLHLPARWPWAGNFIAALTKLRAIPRLA